MSCEDSHYNSISVDLVTQCAVERDQSRTTVQSQANSFKFSSESQWLHGVFILSQSCAVCSLQLVCGCLITFVHISTLLQVFHCWTGLQQQTHLLTCCYTTPGVMLLWAWHTNTHTHFTHTQTHSCHQTNGQTGL